MGAISTISSKGQLTLPQEVRQRLGVGEGDKVEFTFDGQHTVVTPVRHGTDPFEKWIGIAVRPGVTTESILREEREMRGWEESDLEALEH